MGKIRWSSLAGAVLPMFALLPHGDAQSIAARISGHVTDPSQAALSGASATAVNTTTGWKTTATANVEGQYVLYPLPPGVYEVTFGATGMQTARLERLQLYANDNVVRNIRLEVASIAQAVTVSAAAVTVNASPTVESTITEEQVQNLPLNGRDYNQLVLLGAGAIDPGIAPTRTPTWWTAPPTRSRGRTRPPFRSAWA